MIDQKEIEEVIKNSKAIQAKELTPNFPKAATFVLSEEDFKRVESHLPTGIETCIKFDDQYNYFIECRYLNALLK